GGAVISRVTKEAGSAPLREIPLLGGSHSTKRFATDFDQPLTDKAAFRLNGVYENSDSFRNYVNLERFGVNPTLTVASSPQTKITLCYEHFRADRVADRGISSIQGTPADIAI